MVDQITLSPITATDVARMVEKDKLAEISEGHWEKQTVASPEHGRIGGALLAEIYIYLKRNPIGNVYGADTTFVLEGTPDNIITMRLPDVSFVESRRVQKNLEGYYYLAPDLAVEIISATERPGKVKKKLAEYKRTGVKQIWMIYPAQREIVVYLPNGTQTTYLENDIVSGGDILPGFEIKLSEIL